MAYDRRCRDLAVHMLRDYRLSPAERAEETERLAQQIQRMVDTELEALEHRKGVELL